MWSTAVTNYYWLTYYSTNSGTSWSTPRESQPTGGDPTRDANGLLISGAATRPNVLLSGDFAKSGLAYFATAGTGTSGLSRTNDGGKSWRQISLVDWGTTTYRVSEQDAISDQKFYLRFESGSTNITNDSYWLTTNGGAQYERLVSYANPSMPIEFDGMDVTGANKDVVFVKNNSVGGAGKYWRSTDGGATFPRTITAKAVIVEDSVRDENSIITAHAGGALWYTSNLGRPWTEPDESIMSGTPGGISVSGDLWLVRMTSGVIYVSNDAGK
ncbi:MAG: hypothetical protein HYU85_04145, partial [Chloroflexi bacterium]|nr:hypothetical protein [Chloroflexota bacterium]